MDGFSSIAALLSLIGLAVQTTSGLHELCSRCKGSTRDVKDLASDMYALQNVMKQLHGLPLDACTVSTLAGLQYDVSKCKSDLDEWLVQLQKADPDESSGFARVGKKVGLSIGHNLIGEVREKVASHRAQLSLQVGIVGR